MAENDREYALLSAMFDRHQQDAFCAGGQDAEFAVEGVAKEVFNPAGRLDVGFLGVESPDAFDRMRLRAGPDDVIERGVLRFDEADVQLVGLLAHVFAQLGGARSRFEVSAPVTVSTAQSHP